MPTPQGFHLVIPEYKPKTVDDHERNLRALERAINGLPFPRCQRLIQMYENDDPTVYGVSITEGSSMEFELYDGDGYEIYERGVFNTVATIEIAQRSEPGDYASHLSFVRSGDQFTVYSFQPEGVRYRLATADPSVVGYPSTFQGYWNMDVEGTWRPTINVDSPVGETLVRSISVLHTFYPYGLMNSLRLNRETGT